MPAGRILRSARKSANRIAATCWGATMSGSMCSGRPSEMCAGGQCQALKELEISRDLWVLYESSFCRGSWAKCQRRRVASKQMHASCGTQSVQSAAIAWRHCTELASGRTWLRLLQALWPSTPQSPAESWETRGRMVWGQKLANLFLNPVDRWNKLKVANIGIVVARNGSV